MWSRRESNKSIKRSLLNSLSLVFGLIVFAVFLTVDINVDGWVDEQFNQSLINRTEDLKTYFSDPDHRVPNAPLTQLNPEFNRGDAHEFYQLWQGDILLSQSPSLDDFPHIDKIRQRIAFNTTQVIPTTLPNGLSGKASLSSFGSLTTNQSPLYLVFYKSDKGVEQMLLLIDILLVIGFLSSVALMRYLAVIIVDKGLEPLSFLNEQLKALSENEKHEVPVQLPLFKNTVEEIEPIRQQINSYIQSNSSLFAREKRITGDIAHELKTPISEILALTEVYIRYPDDPRISETYQQDILSIATRMKNIVEKLLLLQRSANFELHQETLEIDSLICDLLDEFSFKYSNLSAIVETNIPTEAKLYSDRFSLETILSNLLDNALFYRQSDSRVQIYVSLSNQGMDIEVINQMDVLLGGEQLDKLTAPLYQVDSSRTDTTRYGLGLSIVNNLCEYNGYKLTIQQLEDRKQFVAKIHISNFNVSPKILSDSCDATHS